MDFEKLNNKIVICSNSIKKEILKQKILLNIKFLTLNEFVKKLTYDYDEKAIFYLMQKYNLKYSLAQMYIDNIYYIENKKYESKKLQKLVDIKNEINHLLIYDELFKDYIKTKKIVIIDQKLNKYHLSLLKDLHYEIIDTKTNNYDHQVYLLETLEEEVEYVGNKICELLEQNIDINKIKLTNISDEYINPIKRIFNSLNLKVNINEPKPIISTEIGHNFINKLPNITEAINYLEGVDSPLTNTIINICNDYNWCDYNKDLITHALENTNIKESKYKNAIEIIDLKDANENDYVFMLGFNEGVVPRVYKDEDYINDAIKPDYLETTLEKNISEKEETIKNIKNIKNLIITSKLKTSERTYYVSNLIDNITKINFNSNKTYSQLLDKINLTKYLDDYSKFGVVHNELPMLKNTYDIRYKKYDHSYKKLKDLRNDKLLLSYSSFEQYNECNFKYYVSKILKLDIFEENISATFGSLIHHILELALKQDINIKEEVNKYMEGKIKTNKEKFFTEKLTKDLDIIINIIKEQQKTCYLDKTLYEEKITVEKENYTLTGIIDKVLYKEYDNKTVTALIDYKTGNANIDLGYIDYGLNMQLPIYIYLINNSKLKNVVLAGFYLQKIKLELPKKTNKSLEEMYKDALKLEGYSNKDKEILKDLDFNYENSKVIKGIKTKTDGTFYSYSKVLTNEEIDNLSKISEQKLNETALNIKNNIFNINPKKDKENFGCRFCKFKDICFMEEYDTIKIEKKGDDNDSEETE